MSKKLIIIIIAILIIPVIMLYLKKKHNSDKIITTETQQLTNKQEAIKHSISTQEDSLTLLIKSRAEQSFHTSIFAGIFFGETKTIVQQKLKEYETRYKNTIYLLDGQGTTCEYKIDRITTQYFMGGLMLLNIYFHDTDYYPLLINLFSIKYGVPNTINSNNEWKYANVEIRIDIKSREQYKPDPYNRMSEPLNGGQRLFRQI